MSWIGKLQLGMSKLCLMRSLCGSGNVLSALHVIIIASILVLPSDRRPWLIAGDIQELQKEMWKVRERSYITKKRTLVSLEKIIYLSDCLLTGCPCALLHPVLVLMRFNWPESPVSTQHSSIRDSSLIQLWYYPSWASNGCDCCWAE